MIVAGGQKPDSRAVGLGATEPRSSFRNPAGNAILNVHSHLSVNDGPLMPTNATAPRKRRTVRYRGYEMILEDAEQMAAGEYETVGNWSFGQIMEHLARSFEMSIDDAGPKLALPMRWFAYLFLKGRFLNHTLPSGFKFPGGSSSPAAPGDETTTEQGLERLRRACDRCTTEKQRSFHPLLGHLDTPEWDRFNLRHAELHMSFVVTTADADDEQSNEDLPTPETSHAS